MKSLSPFRWAVAMAITALALSGCGDTNLFDAQSDSSGAQAKLEEGLVALDGGSWTEAQQIFLSLDTSDPEIRKYLASAYVGEAGFDVLTLVEQIDAAQTAGAADDAIYSSITAILDDGDGLISDAELTARADLVLEALVTLGAFEPSAPRVVQATATPEAVDAANAFQAGIYAALHATLMVVGELVSQDPAHPAGTLILTLDELRRQEAVYGVIAAVSLTPQELVDFNADMSLVRGAIVAIEPDYLGGQFDSDIAEELDKFLGAIGYLNGAGGVDGVDNSELQDYLTGLL